MFSLAFQLIGDKLVASRTNNVPAVFLTCLALLAGGLALLAGGLAEANASSIRTVALSGQHAPGTEPGVTFAGFQDVGPFGDVRGFADVRLDPTAGVAFGARLTGPGVDPTNDFGVWTEQDGQLELLARTGQDAPGIGGGVKLAEIMPTTIDPWGRIVFPARVTGPGVQDDKDMALWIVRDGVFDLVVGPSDPVIGTTGDLAFASFRPVLTNRAGQMRFEAHLAGPGVNTSNDYGCWAVEDGQLRFLMREGSPLPFMQPGQHLGQPRTPWITERGQTFLSAPVDGTLKLWLEESGTWQELFAEGSPAPGMPQGTTVDEFRIFTANTAGQFAMAMRLTAPGQGSTWSIVVGDEYGISPIAATGDQTPGLPEGTTLRFNTNFLPIINTAGQVAFEALLDGPGVNASNRYAYFRWDRDIGVTLAARKRDQPPDAPEGVYIDGDIATAVFDSVLNNGGRRTFLFGLSGPAVPSDNEHFGLYAQDLQGELQCIAKSGDAIEVAAGDVRIVTAQRDFPYIFGGVSGDFDDLGNVAFSIRFADDTSGVFVSDLVAIPEPGTLVLLGIGGAILAVGLRRRKLGSRPLATTMIQPDEHN